MKFCKLKYTCEQKFNLKLKFGTNKNNIRTYQN